MRFPKSEIRNPQSFLLLLLFLASFLLASACAARRSRSFTPAAEAEVAASLEAWKRAVERAQSMPPSRLLYDARLTQGLVRVPGTLAVWQSAGSIEALLTGPFGTSVASYSEGALRGEGIKPLAIAPESLRALLAGVWKRGEPEVRGMEGRDSLLSWTGEEAVEGILDVAEARFRSLEIRRAEGRILATYSGAYDPWPSRIEVEDARTGGRLRLTLIGRE
jgi:hypothetical protein